MLVLALGFAVSARAVYTGANVGYLIDDQKAYLTARLGHTFSQSAQSAHSAEVEFGGSDLGEGGLGLKMFTASINYRGEMKTAGSWSPYYGGGLGLGNFKIKHWSVNSSNSTLSANAFAGAAYRLKENSALTLGLRYLWFDDLELNGSSIKLGGQLSIEGGFQLRF